MAQAEENNMEATGRVPPEVLQRRQASMERARQFHAQESQLNFIERDRFRTLCEAQWPLVGPVEQAGSPKMRQRRGATSAHICKAVAESEGFTMLWTVSGGTWTKCNEESAEGVNKLYQKLHESYGDNSVKAPAVEKRFIELYLTIFTQTCPAEVKDYKTSRMRADDL